MKIFTKTFVAAVLLSIGLSQAQASSFAWNASATGLWSVTTNWSLNGTPGSADSIISPISLNPLQVDGGSRTVTNWTDSTNGISQVIGGSGGGGSTLNITGNLAVSGTAVLTFRNSGTTANPLSVSVGSIALASGGLNFGDGTGNYLNSISASSANLTGGTMSFQVGNATTGTATITGALDMSNSSIVNVRTASTTGQSGTLTVGSLASPSTTAVVQVNANSTALTTTGVLALNNASGSATYAGILKNGGTGTSVNTLSVTKAGAGTQVFSGASNTYTGTTIVNAGTLLIDGTQTGGGAYTVDSGGALGGIGSIGLASNTNVSVLSGGKLQASSADSLAFTLSGTGILNVSGALGGAQSMFFTLAAPGSTVVSLSGGLNIGAGVLNFDDFSFTAGTGFNEGIYKLFGGTIAPTGTLGSSLIGTISGKSSTISLSGNDVLLTVVPEPTTWGLLAFSLTTVMVLRRRRRS